MLELFTNLQGLSKMTCNKNSVLWVLIGMAFLGLVGCETQPYKTWQPGDSWWEKDEQARKDAEMTTAADQAAGAKQMPAYTPVISAEPAPLRVSPPVMSSEPVTESMPVVQPVTRHADTAPSVTPPPMVTMEPESPLASEVKSTTKTTGDVLLIDSIQSAPAITTPRNGMTMDKVRSQFGNPESEGSSIGDPPITRWEYKGFSVYFEHDLVLHSVIHRPNRY